MNVHDQRLLLIVDPCSIHERLSAKEYASRLRKLAQADTLQFCLVMRFYCEKPHTAYGWKRFLIAVTALKHILIQSDRITPHLTETPALPA